MNSLWFSYNIYPQTSQHGLDFIITEKLSQVIDILEKESLQPTYFFVRYFDQIGSHLRLRIQLRQMKAESSGTLERVLRDHFSEKLFLVRSAPYEPELVRYGGLEFMKSAEKQFCLSSKTILTLFTDTPNFNQTYQYRIYYCIILHLIFLLSINTDKQIMLKTLHSCTLSWTKFCSRYEKDKEVKKGIELREKSKAMTPAIIEMLTNIAEVGVQNVQFENLCMQNWAWSNAKIFNLQNKSFRNKLSLNQVITILSSLMHMTNNRAGISNSDEPLVFYTAFNAVESLYN